MSAATVDQEPARGATAAGVAHHSAHVATRVVGAARRVPLAAWTVVLAVLLRVAYGAPAAGYDAWWSLEWGRELMHGALPGLVAAWVPTPHPLAIAVAAPLSLLGDAAPGAVGALSLLALAAVAVTAGLLGARLFGPLAGAVAAAILVTRPLLVGAALEGSTDVPFLALALGAGAALAADRERKALGLLLAGGLLRPEAWALAAGLVLWRHRTQTRAYALAAAAPALWLLFDLVCTGDPLHSLHGTRELADGLGRPQSLTTALRVAPDYLTVALGDGVALLGGVAAIAAVWIAPRRAALPLAILGAGLAGFLVLGVAQLPLLYRYTLLPAAALALLAAWGIGEAARRRATFPVAAIGLAVVAAALVHARAPIERHAAHARAARSEQRDLAALLRAAPASACGGGITVTRQRFAPQAAFVTRRAVTDARADGLTLVPNPGSLAYADRLAPTDGAPPPPRGRPVDARGAWTALSTC